jgi:hypothetical protein
MLSLSTPPALWFALTRSQAICRFFRFGFSQSTNLLAGDVRVFAQGTLHLIDLTNLTRRLSPTVITCRLPRPHSGRRSHGHAAFTALEVLFNSPTTGQASLAPSLVVYRLAYRGATREPAPVFSRSRAALPYRAVRKLIGTVVWMRTRSPPKCRLDLAPPMAERSIFGVASIDYSPIRLLMPFGSHFAVDTLPSKARALADEALPPSLDMAPLIRVPEGLQPSRATRCSARTSVRSDFLGSFIIAYSSLPSRCGPAMLSGQPQDLPVPVQRASAHARS